MTEQTPEQGTTTPEDTTPSEGTPPFGEGTYVRPEYQPKVPEGNEGTGRFAVYDKTLERYVGDVTDSKPSAKDAKALTHDGKYAIIEV